MAPTISGPRSLDHKVGGEECATFVHPVRLIDARMPPRSRSADANAVVAQHEFYRRRGL